MRTQDLINGAQTSLELFCNAVIEQNEFVEGLPYVLNFAPLAQINPFQRLLYCRAAYAGYAVVPSVTIEQLAAVNWRGRAVIHLHWLASVLGGVESVEEANVNISEFEQRLCHWRDRGYKIVWTMHNTLPHNAVLIECEIALRKIVIEYSDCIHILARSSVDEAKQYFEIPEDKIFFAPHPSYQDWYANANDPQNARLELGIEPNAFTFVQFGALQRYKGILELVDAFRLLQRKYQKKLLRLVIAGMPSDKEYVEQILSAIAPIPEIRLIQTAVAERDIQTLVNAADVMVAPYIKTLNSGVAMLAATFGKSLIAPNTGGVADVFSADSTLLYQLDDPNGLLLAMEKALTYKIPDSIFSSILERYKPALISDLFFGSLTDRLFSEKKRNLKEHTDV